MTNVFGPGGSFITRGVVPKPPDAERLPRIGKQYYLEVREMFDEDEQLSAPVVLE